MPAELGAHLRNVTVRAGGEDPTRRGIGAGQRDLFTQPYQLPLYGLHAGFKVTGSVIGHPQILSAAPSHNSSMSAPACDTFAAA